ncbi:hypothetical protein ANANG_G00291760 [Anguilla anguilla]|uniref:Uncharacterized protein n=1 Tax=Anguilla anguilla TaxID=7936 RepID=A0A9D3LMZ3_ANGAN|nr:hypothetical protein ANANG_G00291760 [Anguilla anguilla]
MSDKINSANVLQQKGVGFKEERVGGCFCKILHFLQHIKCFSLVKWPSLWLFDGDRRPAMHWFLDGCKIKQISLCCIFINKRGVNDTSANHGGPSVH